MQPDAIRSHLIEDDPVDALRVRRALAGDGAERPSVDPVEVRAPGGTAFAILSSDAGDPLLR